MPGSMPYHLEKGPYFSVLESFCNDDRARLVAALVALRDPNSPLPEIGKVTESTTLGSHGGNVLKRHLYKDWFGFERVPGSDTWTTQPQFSFPENRETGYWQDYHGDVEGIFRETLRRAVEVSLGIDHDKAVDPAPDAVNGTRHWPIELFWKCGQPWWEGWVTWRRSADGTGQVTVVFATPTTNDDVLPDPTTGRKVPDFEIDPQDTRADAGERDQGMWVVTHNKHSEYHIASSVPTESGRWPLFTLGSAYVGHGPIVVVHPSHPDGGPLAKGRKFVAPPG